MFKDKMGRWITSGLFKETSQTSDYVLWTMDEAKALFVATGDPTGYEFATQHVGGWKHWLAIKESPACAPYIAQWEEELEAKVRSAALRNIMTLSEGEKGYQASKFLTEGGWKPKEIGRPTKEKIERESRVKSAMYKEFDLEVVK